MQLLLKSGIAPVDERLGGFTARKPHLVTGSPGSGKTSICLGFLGTALSEGKSAAILTQDDPSDVVEQAADLGLDLRGAAATGRFVMVRYRTDFTTRLERTVSPQPLIDEMVRLMGPGAPDCLAVDSVAPFLDSRSASSIGIIALTQVIERFRATALVTCPGDLRDHYDRRLDPLIRRCAALLHLSSHGQATGRMDVVKSRAPLVSDAPAFFSIRPGRGVVAFDASAASDDRTGSDVYRRNILLVPGADGLPEDLLVALRDGFSVALHASVTLLALDAIPPDLGAVLVTARWDALADATSLLGRLRHLGNCTPAVLVTRGHVRSSDRADALRAGFDEVIADDAGSSEFIARLTAVVRRGRSTTVPVVPAAIVAETKQNEQGSVPSGDEIRFRVALASAADGNHGQLFSVLLLAAGDDQLDTLVGLISKMIRARSGDIVGVVGDRVAVYLAGARSADATACAGRVAEGWRRAGHRKLRVVELSYPTDRERLRVDLALSTSSVHAASRK